VKIASSAGVLLSEARVAGGCGGRRASAGEIVDPRRRLAVTRAASAALAVACEPGQRDTVASVAASAWVARPAAQRFGRV
jgi:hypothetical protein